MSSAKEQSLNLAGPCQSPELLESSSPYPRFFTRLRLALWYVQREGMAAVLRRAMTALAPPNSTPMPTVSLPAPALADEVLNLQPGEWVEVKSREEILVTLDATFKHRGLRFVPEMFDFCGQRLRALRRVEKICLENTHEVRRIRNTVILEGGICGGGGIGCDRSCFHFWRELWLRRLPS